LSELSEPSENRVFHAAMSSTAATRMSPRDGFFHRLDVEDGFT
jgi:hypothetical protein